MMRLLYRFFQGRWIDRLITQHHFETLASSPEALRIIRAHKTRIANTKKRRRGPVGGPGQ